MYLNSGRQTQAGNTWSVGSALQLHAGDANAPGPTVRRQGFVQRNQCRRCVVVCSLSYSSLSVSAGLAHKSTRQEYALRSRLSNTGTGGPRMHAYRVILRWSCIPACCMSPCIGSAACTVQRARSKALRGHASLTDRRTTDFCHYLRCKCILATHGPCEALSTRDHARARAKVILCLMLS